MSYVGAPDYKACILVYSLEKHTNHQLKWDTPDKHLLPVGYHLEYNRGWGRKRLHKGDIIVIEEQQVDKEKCYKCPSETYTHAQRYNR